MLRIHILEDMPMVMARRRSSKLYLHPDDRSPSPILSSDRPLFFTPMLVHLVSCIGFHLLDTVGLFARDYDFILTATKY